MINVTKPFLPPKDEFDAYIKGVWQRNWLTNDGPLVKELELKLKQYLNIHHLLYVSNGTIALQIAIKALGLKGDIITTPFSYVATTSSIVWESCNPVFVDIDPFTFNIDASKIEMAISERTSAILATHVYGNPCDIDAIQNIAEKHGLKVIYDGAHCFGTNYNGKSVFAYGDICTTSFHATKLFHTIEGGAIFTQNFDLFNKMALMRNFGHDGFDKFSGVGINGKNSEFHAAMGLVNLKYIDDILKRRRESFNYYEKALSGLDVQRLAIHSKDDFNYAYYPIILRSEEFLLRMLRELGKNWIYPRRYFYPTLAELDYVVKNTDLPIAMDVSKRVLCLPLYYELTNEEIDLVARIMLRVQNN